MEAAYIVLRIIAVGLMEHGEIADGMCGKKIPKYHFCLGAAIGIALLRHGDLHQVVEVPGYLKGIPPADRTKDLVHRYVKRTDEKEYGEAYEGSC
jgi:hypothetical protein